MLLAVLFYSEALPFANLPSPSAILAKSLPLLGYAAALRGWSIFDKEETAYV